MRKHLRYFLLLILASFTLGISAQSPRMKAASWKSEISINGQTGEIHLTMTPATGWHIYGTSLPKGGPKPMIFDFSESVGVELIGETAPSVSPQRSHDDTFDLDLDYWSAKVVFKQKFRVTGSNAVIKGTVRYQGCNDETCAPPAKYKFSHAVN